MKSEFPPGTVLSRENKFNPAIVRTFEVVSSTPKKVWVVRLDGPWKGGRVSFTVPQARDCTVVGRIHSTKET